MSLFVPRPALHLAAAILLGIGLLGCGGSEEFEDVVTDEEEGPIPTPPQAERAVNEALQAFNEHCLAPQAQGRDAEYPLPLFNPSASSFTYRQLRALSTVGLLDTTITQGKRGLPVYRFALTETGRAAQYDIAQGRRYRPMFCYTTPQVVEVDSIKSVYTSGPNPLANVWFAYRYRPLAGWIDSTAVRRSFSGLPTAPSPTDTLRTNQLLMRADSAWVDRRLVGYERPPERPSSASGGS